jgi:hypothetical protein
MDLSALLAREGIQADDAEALVAWARRRAAARVTRIEPGSALAHQLGVALEHARSGEPAAAADTADVPVPVVRQSSRSGPRSIGRSVSSPHLGAAVQAALTRNEPALEKALETAEQEQVAVEEPAPAPAPEPEPEPVVADDDDASIGGFNRFAFSLRRRVIETSPVEEAPTPARAPEPELAADSSESAAIWQAIDLELPAPPGFESRPKQNVPTDRAGDSETSGSLVVGIPDDDSIDIPLPRPRPRSDGRSVASPSAAPSGPHPEAQAAGSSEALELDSATLALDGLDLDIPEPPTRETTRPQPMGRPNSSAFRAAPPPPPRSGPHRAASGPQPVFTPAEPARPPSAPQTAAPSAVQATGPQKYPTPQSSARRKTSTAEQKQVPKPASEPKAAAGKKGGKARKKVVELGSPVAAPVAAAPAVIAPRKASIGNHLPTGEPSSPGHQIPAYLQDDDE